MAEVAGRVGELKKMSLLTHLEELRKRLIRSVLAVVVAFLVTFFYCKEIFNFVARPLLKLLPKGGQLVYTDLSTPFMLFMKVALVTALILAAPVILYQLWLFISPGLYRHEKRYVLPFMFFSSLLFLSGCAFAYLVIFPATCAFFIQVGSPYTPLIDISFFFDLAMVIVLGMGAVFQMPIVIVFLTMMGVVSPGFLLRKIRHAILIIVIVAAVLSPTTDVLNLLLFSAPMVVLYVLSIGLSWIVARGKRRRREAEEAAGA